jgi:hypothetical protein
LDGDRAIEYILALEGDPPDLIPDPPPETPRLARRTVPYRPVSSNNLTRRIFAYLARLPNLGEGQGRDDVAY